MSKIDIQLHARVALIQVLRSAIEAARPNIQGVDSDIDDCLASLTDAEMFLEAARETVQQYERTLDQIDAGDLIQSRGGIIACAEETYP
jgi:hypothetical protein